MSPKVDSPTCSVLAADFSTNFHVNNSNFKTNNPKKILLPSMMNDENDEQDDGFNKENSPSSSLSNKGIFTFSRKHLRKTTSNASFKSNSLSSSFYHNRSISSSSIMFNQGVENVTNPNTQLKTLDISSISIPTPISERVKNIVNEQSKFSPETQAIISRNKLKKSFSLMNPQHNSFECSSSTSSSSASENEEDDSDTDQMADNNGMNPMNNVGSPLQQRNNRMLLNSTLRSKLQRATSMIQSHTDLNHDVSMSTISNSKITNHMRKPQLFKLSTSDIPNESNLNSLSAGTSQLTNNISGFSFDSHSTATQDFNSNNSIISKTSIKTFTVDGCTIPRINVDQFHDILLRFKVAKDSGPNVFDELVIIDCRFEYEFKGGHIDSALNVSSKQELENLLLNADVINKHPADFTSKSRKLLIFHCEFSSHRGPLMANSLRTWDRYLNKEHYPNLYYPDIVILEGGYKKFYEKFNGVHCYPLNYIEMDHPKYKAECEAQLDKLRRDSKMSLTRKNSFCSGMSTTSGGSSGNSSNSSVSSLGSLKKGFSTNSVLNFGGSTKTTIRSSNSISNLKNTSELGGFGNSNIDLDNLCDDSPVFTRTNTTTSTTTTTTTSSSSSSSLSSNLFKLPSLPTRHHLGVRSNTVASFNHHSQYYKSSSSSQSNTIEVKTPPHFPHLMKSRRTHIQEMSSKFTKKFEKHIDTPISKK
ncbi:hypothetical protein CANARDRAFT_180691, partial [[Candida] arabinofermentans NRRL YB-2248]